MSHTCPTLMIKKANKWGYAIINEADFDPQRHVLLGAEGEPEAPAAIQPEPAAPAEWEGLHWKKRIALARQLTGREAADAAEADELIRAHIAGEGA